MPGLVSSGRLDETDVRAYNPFMPRPADARAFLQRRARAIVEERLRFTWKADDELAGLGWSRRDALDQLAVLDQEQLLRTELAKSAGAGIIWVFCPLAWELERHLWIRLTEGADYTILVSFHIAEGDPWT